MTLSRQAFVNILIISFSLFTALGYFLVHPLVVPIGLGVEILLLTFYIKPLNERVWVLYLILFQYFGLTIIGVKTYDILVLVVLALITIGFWDSSLDRKKLIHPQSIVLYLVLGLLVIAIPFAPSFSDGVREFIRYLMSFLVFFIFSSLPIASDKFIKYLPAITLASLVTGVVVFYFTYYRVGQIVLSGPISISHFFNPQESRTSGFSTDPNKFYLYLFTILLIVDIVEEKQRAVLSRVTMRHIRIVRYIVLVGAILSLSRVAMISVIAYLVFRFFRVRVLGRNNKLVFQLMALAVLLVAVNFQLLVSVLDDQVNAITRLMGRSRTLEYAPSVTDSNRMKIWLASIDLWKEKLWTGQGIFAWNSYLPYPPHNTFLFILLDFGLLGLGFLVYTYNKFFRRLYHESFIFLFLLPFLTLDLHNYRLYFIVLSILLFQTLKSPSRG